MPARVNWAHGAGSFRVILLNSPCALAQNKVTAKRYPGDRLLALFIICRQNRGRMTAVGGVNTVTEHLLTADWSPRGRSPARGVGHKFPMGVLSSTLSRTYGGQGLSYEMHAI